MIDHTSAHAEWWLSIRKHALLQKSSSYTYRVLAASDFFGHPPKLGMGPLRTHFFGSEWGLLEGIGGPKMHVV